MGRLLQWRSSRTLRVGRLLLWLVREYQQLMECDGVAVLEQQLLDRAEGLGEGSGRGVCALLPLADGLVRPSQATLDGAAERMREAEAGWPVVCVRYLCGKRACTPSHARCAALRRATPAVRLLLFLHALWRSVVAAVCAYRTHAALPIQSQSHMRMAEHLIQVWWKC